MIKSFSLRMEVSDFLQSASKAKATVVEKQGKISQIFTPPPLLNLGVEWAKYLSEFY